MFACLVFLLCLGSAQGAIAAPYTQTISAANTTLGCSPPNQLTLLEMITTMFGPGYQTYIRRVTSTIASLTSSGLGVVGEPLPTSKCCKLNNVTSASKYLQYSKTSARLTEQYFDVSKNFTIPTTIEILSFEYDLDCTVEIMVSKEVSTGQFFLRYYTGTTQNNLTQIQQGTTFKELLVEQGKIYVRMDTCILVYQSLPTLDFVQIINLAATAADYVSMMVTDTGFFIYAINNQYFVLNPLDSYNVNTTVTEVSNILKMTKLSSGRVMTMTANSLIEKSTAPTLLTDSTYAISNP